MIATGKYIALVLCIIYFRLIKGTNSYFKLFLLSFKLNDDKSSQPDLSIILTNCEYQILSKNISSSYSIQSYESTITYDSVLQSNKEA